MSEVGTVRRFNRFYTRRIGILEEGLLHTPFSLSEARVLYEIAHRHQPSATELARDLRLDPGYLSRILRRLVRHHLVRRAASEQDARRSLLSLTPKGRRAFATLDRRQEREVAGLLGGVPSPERPRLLAAMAAIERILDPPPPPDPARTPYLLRPPQPGDLGWVVHRHGALYAREFGYNEQFEALVARIVAEFVERYDPTRERCWIAEREGEIVGAVFLVKKSTRVARLRLLYVEPSARGLGIGERLVAECIRFARQARYRTLTLWTQSHLTAARRIYLKAGFQLVAQQAHHSYGRDLVAETWDLALH